MTATAALLDRPASAVASSPRTIALLGNPNTGKTTVFNRLCGARAKTSNFPGTTTAIRKGRADLGVGVHAEVVDLPGIYDLSLDSAESHIVRRILRAEAGERPDIVVVVVDACNLARKRIEDITAEVEVWKTYEGAVLRLLDFGAIVQVLPGKDGLLHISQIAKERVNQVSDYLKEGQIVRVKVLEADDKGRLRLSMKAAAEEDAQKAKAAESAPTT